MPRTNANHSKASPLRVRHTFTQREVGLSAQKPVQVSSYIHECDQSRILGMEEPGHPGPHWGPLHYMPLEDDHTPAHNHQFCEITLIRKGDAVHHGLDHKTEVTPSTVVVVPRGMAQSYSNIHTLEYTNLYYLSEWLVDDLRMWWAEDGVVPLFLATSLFSRQLIRDTPVFKLTEMEMEKVDDEIRDIAQELTRENPSLIFLRGSLLKLFTYLARSYVRCHPNRKGMPFRSEIWIALQYIEQLLAQNEPFSADTLANTCFLSRKRFSAIFKEATGLSPTNYYQQRRVQRAAQLLLDPEKTVAEVSYILGYCDASHFSNIFKRYRGTTPKAYRQLYLVE